MEPDLVGQLHQSSASGNTFRLFSLTDGKRVLQEREDLRVSPCMDYVSRTVREGRVSRIAYLDARFP